MAGLMDTTAALTALVQEWLEQRPMSVDIRTYSFEPVDIPDVLSPTITDVEPYRSQVIDDARQWLAFPIFRGLAVEYGVEDFEIVRADAWESTISPLRFWASWASVMSAMDPAYDVEYHRERWERVVHEDGRWKIAVFWSDEDRDRAREEVAKIKRFQHRA